LLPKNPADEPGMPSRVEVVTRRNSGLKIETSGTHEMPLSKTVKIYP
jgi:hypothetical protein